MWKKILRLFQGYSTHARLFWVVTLIMSFSGMAIFIYYTFYRYYSTPVSMAFETEYMHWDISFPAVSVCLVKGTFDQLIQPVMTDLNITSNKYPKQLFAKTVYDCMFDKLDHLEAAATKCDELNTKYKYEMDLLRERVLPKDCKKIMDSLYYNEVLYICSEVFKFHKTKSGYCFIGNSVIDNGYSFENLTLKYGSASKNRILSFRLKRFKFWDYELLVHSPEEFPFYNIISKDIHPKAETKFSYNVISISTDEDAAEQPISTRACRFPHENLDGSPFHYSFSTCMDFLRIQLELQECNCTHSIYPDIYEVRYCNLSELECIFRANINSKARGLATEKNICVPSCTEQILEFTGYSEIEKTKNNDYSNVSFEITNLPHTRYKRTVTRTKLDLIVSLSGLAGLFFGVSVLNLIEAVYYIVTVR